MSSKLLICCFAFLAGSQGFAQDSASYWPPQPLPKIVLRGSEEGGSYVEDTPGWSPHLVTLFLTEKNVDSPWHTAQQHLDWAKQPTHSYVADGTGALVIIAHPALAQFDQIMRLPGLNAMEVNHSGRAEPFEELWDRVLTARLKSGLGPLWGTGADDTHSTSDIGLSWIALRLGNLSEATLKKALRSGNFYVSNGPVITDVQVRGPVIEVKTAEAADIRWLRSGQYGTGPAEVSTAGGANRCLKIDRAVKASSYALTEHDGTTNGKDALFVRCLVTTGTPGKAAQTQPFVIRGPASVDNPYAPSGQWFKGMTHNHADFQEGHEDAIQHYYAAYAAKGYSAAFEAAYDYWIMPLAYFPPDRAPLITEVIPQRVLAGKQWTVSVNGRAFAEGAKVLLDGKALAGVKRPAPGRLEIALPKSLQPGRYELTVLNPDGLQHTLERSLIVQQPSAVNEGWTSFTPRDSRLGSRYTYALERDPEKGIWVATNHGISYYDGRDWTTYRDESSPADVAAGSSPRQARLDDTIYDLAIDPDRTVWFTCLRGVGALHPDGKRDRWPWRESGLSGHQVNQVLRSGGLTYITMHNQQGFFVLREGKWNRIPVPVGPRDILTAIVRDARGVFWLGSANGLLRWDAEKGEQGWTPYTTANSGLPDNFVRRLAFDTKGALWIATSTKSEKPVGGLASFRNGEWTVYHPGNSPLPERRVWSVFCDSRGNVWAATSRGVLCRSADGSWRVYDMLNSGLADDLVTDIGEDNEGNLWFSTANGVSRLKSGS